MSGISAGVYHRSLPDSDTLDACSALERARELGFTGCLFGTPLELSPTLDAGRLREVRQHADGLGLTLGLGAGQIHPYRLERTDAVCALGDGDFGRGLEKLVRAAAAIGCHDLFFVVGLVEDRADRTVPWADQLAAVERFLRGFAPVLRDAGVRLTVKTHEEITTFEIVRLVEAVGPDVLGVALDPVNVLVRVEDPVAAAARVAPYVRSVHLDDAVVRRTDEGFARRLVPLGAGSVDWTAILAALAEHAPRAAYWVELHRAAFDMPVYDPDWLCLQPDLGVTEFASLARMAATTADRLAAGAFPTLDTYQHDPGSRMAPTLSALAALT